MMQNTPADETAFGPHSRLCFHPGSGDRALWLLMIVGIEIFPDLQTRRIMGWCVRHWQSKAAPMQPGGNFCAYGSRLGNFGRANRSPRAGAGARHVNIVLEARGNKGSVGHKLLIDAEIPRRQRRTSAPPLARFIAMPERNMEIV